MISAELDIDGARYTWECSRSKSSPGTLLEPPEGGELEIENLEVDGQLVAFESLESWLQDRISEKSHDAIDQEIRNR